MVRLVNFDLVSSRSYSFSVVFVAAGDYHDMETSLLTQNDGGCRCVVCNTLCRSRKNARVHFERAHALPEFYECCVCQRVIKSKYNFRVHVNKAHGIRGRNTVEQYGKLVSST